MWRLSAQLSQNAALVVRTVLTSLLWGKTHLRATQSHLGGCYGQSFCSSWHHSRSVPQLGFAVMNLNAHPLKLFLDCCKHCHRPVWIALGVKCRPKNAINLSSGRNRAWMASNALCCPSENSAGMKASPCFPSFALCHLMHHPFVVLPHIQGVQCD